MSKANTNNVTFNYMQLMFGVCSYIASAAIAIYIVHLYVYLKLYLT